MPIPVIEQIFNSKDSGNTSNLVVSLSGIVANDLLVAIGSCATIAASNRLSMAGWTEVAEYSFSGGPSSALYWKKAVGGETSATLSLVTAAEAFIHVLRISDGNTDDPFDQIVHGSTSNSRYPGVSGFISTEDNTVGILAYQQTNSSASGNNISALTAHPPWTLARTDVDTAQFDMRGLISTQDLPSAGVVDGAAYNMGVAGYGNEWAFNIRYGAPASPRRIFIT